MANRTKRIRPAGQGPGSQRAFTGARSTSDGAGVHAALLASSVPPLSASPEEVRAGGDEIAALRATLGGPDVLAHGPAELAVSYDPRAYIKAQRVAGALSGAHPAVQAVVKETGIDAARLAGRSMSYNTAVRLRSTAEIIAEALSDSRALVQRRALRMCRDLIAVIERRIAALPPGDAARVRLEAQAARLLDKVRALRDAAAARGAETRALGEEQSGRLQDASARLGAAEALSAAAGGRPMPAAEAARLLSALVPRTPAEAEANDRRTGPR